MRERITGHERHRADIMPGGADGGQWRPDPTDVQLSRFRLRILRTPADCRFVDVAAYFVGLACGLVFLLPTVRRMRTARAAMEAARALERSTQVELCVVRERNASEVAGLRRSHDDELNALRGRFGLEVRMLREAVSSARQELDRNQGIERLVTQVAETVERVERELRRIDRRPRVKRR